MKPIQIAFINNADSHINPMSSYILSDNMDVDWFNHPQQLQDDVYDIVFVDMSLPDINTDTLSTLLSQSTRTRWVAICAYPDPELAQQLMRIGVTGVVLRHELHMGFQHLIHTLHGGRLVISPAIIQHLVQPKKKSTYIP